jgi:hypothetical protein
VPATTVVWYLAHRAGRLFSPHNVAAGHVEMWTEDVMMSSKVERRAGWRTEKGGVGGMRRVQRSRDFLHPEGTKLQDVRMRVSLTIIGNANPPDIQPSPIQLPRDASCIVQVTAVARGCMRDSFMAARARNRRCASSKLYASGSDTAWSTYAMALVESGE